MGIGMVGTKLRNPRVEHREWGVDVQDGLVVQGFGHVGRNRQPECRWESKPRRPKKTTPIRATKGDDRSRETTPHGGVDSNDASHEAGREGR